MIIKFTAVLFDMDGVIVDSMPYHFISWFEVLGRYNVRVTPNDIFNLEGAKWVKVIQFVFKRDKRRFSEKVATHIANERLVLFKKYFRQYLFNEIYGFIKYLKNQGVLVGLVTGSYLSESKKMLPRDLYKLFDTIVTGDMVKKGKPHPEPYITASKNLKVLPKDCLVIENAPYGIKSAKSAKMYCCAIATSLPKSALFEANKIFDTHEDLYECFGYKY